MATAARRYKQQITAALVVIRKKKEKGIDLLL
jgi:hypothetical protein